ncbi:MAG: helix-turn-helix transcriptional regulator [Parasporobacterium sp.]|nr:helix-turn-helix transcriptional regulator [Parasporobacterium sp.]
MKERKQLNIDIGSRIKKSREIAGLTQERLADLIDVSVQYISDLERGVVGASLSTIIRICETLHVSADFILMGREPQGSASSEYSRLDYLSSEQKEVIHRGINVLMDAMMQTNVYTPTSKKPD